MLQSKAALIIGINYIDQRSIRLEGCVNDAVQVYDMLTEELDYQPSSITMLVDDNVGDSKPGNISLPSKHNIIKALSTLVELAKTGCQEIWVHYSGHGYYRQDHGSDEKDGYDELLIPSDYSQSGFISDDLIYKLFSSKLPDTCHAVVIMDCCHSGTMLDLRYKYRVALDNKHLIENDRITNNNVICISGCRDEEVSQEAQYFERQEQNGGKLKTCGAMTLSLIATLQRYDYNIHASVLIKEMRKQLTGWGFSQRPQLTSSFPIKDTTIIFERLVKPKVRGFATSFR